MSFHLQTSWQNGYSLVARLLVNFSGVVVSTVVVVGSATMDVVNSISSITNGGIAVVSGTTWSASSSDGGGGVSSVYSV